MVSKRLITPLLIAFLLTAVSCQPSPPPTTDPTSLPPTPTLLARAATLAPTASPTIGPSPTPSPTTTSTPFPVGRALKPGQIPMTPTPSATPLRTDVTVEPTPLGTIEWRPPPLPVPLAIHPDDHYWLTRPLPSGTRNYDLEWYPYGNDVLVPQYAPYRIHHGLDFPNPPGTQVLAASSGVVVWAGPRPSPRDGLNYYGNTIIIKHDWQWQGQDVYTLYAHTLEMFVNEGDYVEQGQLLAGVGSSGQVSGPHLHFEVRVGENNYWDTRNPALWIAPYEGWGTLAGRFIDEVGNPVLGADITVVPRNVDTSIRRQRTYEDGRLKTDDVWRENFVVGDLPAGIYDVFLEARLGEGIKTDYQRTIQVLPGRTNFMVVQGEFIFVPTPTPLPTVPLPLTATLGLTGTAGISGTIPLPLPTVTPSE
jgi:murein DD-endopeptidase MepM/ murein hydrolase activator NlpD